MTKKLKNLLSKWNVLAIALVAMMSVVLSSCGGDDEKDPVIITPDDKYDVAGTNWAYSLNYGDGVSESIELRFSTMNATMIIKKTVNNQTLSETYNYSYKRSENLIIFTPVESGRPTLEGEIVNSMKMIVTNTYNKASMEFYKQ